MHSISTRVFLGCVAGALAMLMFHQTTLEAFYWCGLIEHPAFRVAHVAPLNVPMVVSITFWGAVYGGALGLFLPRLPNSFVARVVLASVLATMLAWFIVRPLAGRGVAFGWQTTPMLLSVGANVMWGFGWAVIMPLLNPRCLVARSRAWAAARNLAT